MSNENLPNIPKTQVINIFKDAFNDVQNSLERGKETAIESQNNQMSSGTIPLHTGVQNILITLLLQIAKKLGLGENDLEAVFNEVLKLLSTYKSKKGEN